LSQAISEGDGISLVAMVATAADAALAEENGAEAVVVSTASPAAIAAVSEATSLPLMAEWSGTVADDVTGLDGCILSVDADHAALERVRATLGGALELAFRIDDEDELEAALEGFDPEILVLGASEAEGEDALEHVLDLLADVPAGKLAIAELEISGREDVGALERAGFDGVIVASQRVGDLVREAPPDV
jgi:hypothetical protein